MSGGAKAQKLRIKARQQEELRMRYRSVNRSNCVCRTEIRSVDLIQLRTGMLSSSLTL